MGLFDKWRERRDKWREENPVGSGQSWQGERFTEKQNKQRTWWDKYTPWNTRAEKYMLAVGEPPSPEDIWEGGAEGEQDRQRARYQPYIEQMQGLMGQMPTAPDLGQQYAGMEGLIQRLEAGPQQGDIDQAMGYTAQQMGFGSAEEYQDYLRGMQPQDISSYQGLSEADRNLLEREKRGNIRNLNEQMRLAVEAASGATGSYVRGMTAAEEHRTQIANTALQYDVAIMNENFTRQLAQQERTSRDFFQAVQAGQASTRDFLVMKQEGVMGALSGYMQEASLKLSQYGTELDALGQQADIIYKTAMTELGIDEGIINQMAAEFEMAMAPYYVQMEQYGMLEDIRAATGLQPFVKDAPVNLVFAADYSRMGSASEEDKDFYSATDTGFISQNVYLFCASEGLATVVRGLIDREALAEKMGLRSDQRIILAQTVGYPAEDSRQ